VLPKDRLLLLLGKSDVLAKGPEKGVQIPGLGPLTVEKFLVLFLWVWWVVGASYLTFEGPFKITGNGYFGSWASLIVSTLWLFGGEAKDAANSAQAGLLFASVVLIIAICVDDYEDTSEGVLGIVVASLSIVGLLVSMFVARVAEIVAIVLAILWAVVAIVLTFVDPFEFTGNGYFASWAGLLCAICLCAGKGGATAAKSPATPAS